MTQASKASQTPASHRRNHSTGSHFEETLGYSRAVQVGRRLWVAGTIGYDYQTMSLSDSPAGQTRQCLENMAPVFVNLGQDLSAIVQMDVYVTRPGIAEEVLSTLRAALGDCALTVIQLDLPYDPAVCVELRPFAVLKNEGAKDD